MPARPVVFLVLGAGVTVVSFASILIRLAHAEGASSLTIAAARLGLAAAILAPFAWTRAGAEIRRLGRHDLALCTLSGGFLALHFWTWITSLEFTSVASSTALVTTNPIWVGLASAVLLRERPRGAEVAGIALSIAGSLLIFAADTGPEKRGADPMLGNALALAGALCATGYLLAGRALRERLSLLAYVWTAYSIAAILLLGTLLMSDERVAPVSPPAWLFITLLALGPQLVGHTSFNWALRRLSATFVAVAILGEPVGSALLAFLFFGEAFTGSQFAGFVVLLAGIFIAARGERKHGG